jgi:hypothetical protein
MSIEQKVDEITRKIQGIESQVEQIKNMTAPDNYLRDYSIRGLDTINSELQKAIEFLDKDQNLVDHLKVKIYVKEFSSKLAPLTLMFELYYAFRIAHLFRAINGDPGELLAIDRFLRGFYVPKDSFEKFMDEKDYSSLRTELSDIKTKFDAVHSVWEKIFA